MSLDENDAGRLRPVWREDVPHRTHELLGKGYLPGRTQHSSHSYAQHVGARCQHIRDAGQR